MKKTLTVSFLLASMLLAACNTTETGSSSNTTTEANEATQQPETNNNEQLTNTADTTNSETVEVEPVEKEDAPSTEEVEKEETEQTPQTNVDSSTPVESGQSIDFTFNGEAFQAKTNAVTSEQLGYKMQLAEGFTLTSEEPGSDLLFYTADSSYSMRIEYYAAADHSYDALLANVENLMIASTNNNFETLTIEQSAYGIHKGTQYISVDETSGLQTIGAIFEKGDKIIVLTIFDGPENSLKNAFLQMAYSIE